MNIALYTLGCKLNLSETEAIASAILAAGFELADYREKAGIYIINTCTVTSKSEQKARHVIRSCRARNPEALIIVTGCYAQLDPLGCADPDTNTIVVSQEKKSMLFSFFRSADMSLFAQCTGTEQKELLNSYFSGFTPENIDPFDLQAIDFSFHSRGFLKIQDGCDCRCSYCRVPLARGKSISLDPDAVFERIGLIEKAGFAEIVITGVNITAYQHSGLEFCGLIQKILALPGRMRFRVSSLEPESITPELAEILGHPRICAHFHIPVQSGSDRILRLMKRRSNSASILKAAYLLRASRPGCFLGADVLTGFPGETDEDYELTKSLIEKAGFSQLHVFQFSLRPGTAAYHFKPLVPERIKKERSQELRHISDEHFESYRKSWQGKEVDVILEKQLSSPGNILASFRGLSGNYLELEVSGIPEAYAKKRLALRCRIVDSGDVMRAEFLSVI